MDQELIRYLNDQVKRGTPRETIKQTLRANGWPDAVIEEALQSIANTSPPVSLAPIAQIAMSDRFPPIFTTQNFIKLMLVIGVIGIGIGLYEYRFGETPKEVLAKMFSALPDVKSGSFRGELTAEVRGAGFTHERNPQLITSLFKAASLLGALPESPSRCTPGTRGCAPTDPAPRTMHFSTTFDGKFDIHDPDNAQQQFRFSTRFGEERTEFSVDAELRRIRDKGYFKIDGMPRAISENLAHADPAFNDIEHQWFSIDLKTAEQLLGEENITFTNKNTQPGNRPNAKQEQEIKELVRNARALRINADLPRETVTGHATRHYEIAFDQNGLKQFIRGLSRIQQGRDISESDLREFDQFVDEYGLPKGEIWIGTADYLPYKTLITWTIQPPRQNESAAIRYELIFDEFNQSVDVEMPDNSEDFTKRIEDSLAASRKRVRDARRIADIRQIQLGVELYYDANRSYPTILTQLAPEYLTNVPADPTDKALYRYVPHFTGARVDSYHLGANLEESTHYALSNDRDCNSRTGTKCPFRLGWNPAHAFNGDDRAGCAGEAGRACYDVTP